MTLITVIGWTGMGIILPFPPNSITKMIMSFFFGMLIAGLLGQYFEERAHDNPNVF